MSAPAVSRPRTADPWPRWTGTELAGAGMLALPLVVLHPPLALLLGVTAAVGGGVGVWVHGSGRRTPYWTAAAAGTSSLLLLVVMAVFLVGMTTDSETGVVESVTSSR